MKILIFTVGYNCEKTVRRTIDSVLGQTFTDFEYHFINNGCTDGTSEILSEYSKKDSRFIVHEREQNHVVTGETHPLFTFLREQTEEISDYYITNLDSDDWLEPETFEKMYSIAEEGDYDIVATGAKHHYESYEKLVIRKNNYPIIMTEKEFSEYYRDYHWCFRTIWGKFYKKSVIKKAMSMYVENQHVYGMDTYFAFLALRNSEKVYIDNSAYVNYSIRVDSDSYKEYTPKRKEADIFLFNEAIDFLSQYGEISPQNLHFIYMVYVNAIKDTVENLVDSKLSAQEKLKEYIKIFARPETHNALSINNDTIENVKCELMFGLLSFVTEIKEDFDKVSQILNILSPACSSVINKDTVKLFARNDNFKALLFKDDKNLLSEYLLTLVLNNDKLTKVYDFPLMLGNLASENSLASTVKSVEFIRLYSDVYSLVWNAKNIEALDKMTEILFSGNELNCAEDFLNLYVTLAALENHVDAFLFGNIQKAYLFIDEKRFDEAKQIVNDLVEMGAGESEDVVELVRMLNAE